ncbi:cation-transporting P-type ATPase [Methylomicrobium sp. RS1]|nr:cation-transporting P-type ATPase [Methylomicrobium sp. RS1]
MSRAPKPPPKAFCFQGEPLPKLLATLKTSPQGLTSEEARLRLSRYGENQIVFHRTRSPWLLFFNEFKALFPLLLLAAALLAFWADHLTPGEGYNLIGWALSGVVLLNAIMSFLQNYKVEKLMLSFLDYIPKSVNVLRDGKSVLRDAKELVPGDILLVQEGDKISADGAILESAQLRVDESLLSGESLSVEKQAGEDRIEAEHCAWSGATAIKGHARVLVVNTGRNTRIGSISELSQRVQADLTPMQKELRNFVRKITYLAITFGGLFFSIGFLIGDSFWTNLVFAIGIIVANVPEGLLPTVTLALTQASLRMAKRNAVVKDILSVETLGCTSVICTDKTGTLTQNRLHVEKLYMDFEDYDADTVNGRLRHRTAWTMQEIMALCNETVIALDENGKPTFSGDPTEIALASFVDRQHGYGAIRGRYRLQHSRPFDAALKFMTATYSTSRKALLLTAKGAPEVILERCTQIYSEGLVHPLRADAKRGLTAKADEYAGLGLRVLAFAYAIVEHPEDIPENLVFVGLAGLVDPPRPQVPNAVAACRTAGIRIIVISGDSGETVAYIAKRLGIVDTPSIITGNQLAEMSPDDLLETLRNEQVVFARTAPEQKLTIVDALKAMGEVVAMTGDGVNDSPALKRADIGVAMGKKGTDVAKEASDIILLDDNFATIVKAIEEGRAVYENIKKFITYILASNIPEVVPYIAYVLFPIPLPITVIQILSIDLITDMLPAIGLGNEPPDTDVMRQPPRRSNEPLVSLRTFIRSYAIIGPAQALLAFVVFFTLLFDGGWGFGKAIAENDPLYLQASGAFLTTIIFCQIGNVMACRTSRQSALGSLTRFNPWIVCGILFELAFILAIVYLPQAQLFFNTAPIAPYYWVLIVPAPFVILALDEARKWLARHGWHGLEV